LLRVAEHRLIAEFAVMRGKPRKISVDLGAAVQRVALYRIGGVGGPDHVERIAMNERIGRRADCHDGQHAPHREIARHADLRGSTRGPL